MWWRTLVGGFSAMSNSMQQTQKGKNWHGESRKKGKVWCIKYGKKKSTYLYREIYKADGVVWEKERRRRKFVVLVWPKIAVSSCVDVLQFGCEVLFGGTNGGGLPTTQQAWRLRKKCERARKWRGPREGGHCLVGRAPLALKVAVALQCVPLLDSWW